MCNANLEIKSINRGRNLKPRTTIIELMNIKRKFGACVSTIPQSEQIPVDAAHVDEEVKAVQKDESDVAITIEPQTPIHLLRHSKARACHTSPPFETSYHLQDTEHQSGFYDSIGQNDAEYISTPSTVNTAMPHHCKPLGTFKLKTLHVSFTLRSHHLDVEYQTLVRNSFVGIKSQSSQSINRCAPALLNQHTCIDYNAHPLRRSFPRAQSRSF